MPRHALDALHFTHHALTRMNARALHRDVVADVLRFGWRHHARHALTYVVGRRAIRDAARRGIDLRRCDGVHVVCSPEGAVLTVYRNRRWHLREGHDRPGSAARRRRPG